MLRSLSEMMRTDIADVRKIMRRLLVFTQVAESAAPIIDFFSAVNKIMREVKDFGLQNVKDGWEKEVNKVIQNSK